MVKIKSAKGYELNHIYRIRDASSLILVGQSASVVTGYIELFEKSLALAGDLKKLPVIRGFHGSFNMHVNYVSRIDITTRQTLTFQIIVWNGEAVEENIIIQQQGNAVFDQAASVISVFHSPIVTWDYEGGILGFDRINYELALNLNLPAAVSDLEIETVYFTGFFEIDWIAVTSEEFRDYILESVYAEQ